MMECLDARQVAKPWLTARLGPKNGDSANPVTPGTTSQKPDALTPLSALDTKPQQIVEWIASLPRGHRPCAQAPQDRRTDVLQWLTGGNGPENATAVAYGFPARISAAPGRWGVARRCSKWCSATAMPKVRTSRTRVPDGWDVIGPTLEALEVKMREGEGHQGEGGGGSGVGAQRTWTSCISNDSPSLCAQRKPSHTTASGRRSRCGQSSASPTSGRGTCGTCLRSAKPSPGR